MQLALIHGGRVQAEADAATAALKGPDGKSLYDIRDVSTVAGIAPGWLANADGSFTPPPIAAPTVAQLLAYAKARHEAAEPAGVVVGGVAFATDLESQTRIANAYAYAALAAVTSVRFKAVSGWVVLSIEQLKAVALAVGAHVQACFDAEDTADAGINASPPKITTLAQVDAVFAGLIKPPA